VPMTKHSPKRKAIDYVMNRLTKYMMHHILSKDLMRLIMHPAIP
jgi:hypothetical protein